MTQEEKSTKDYTFLSPKEHKRDLENAKLKWREKLQSQGIAKRQYKYNTIAKIQ